MVSCVQEGPWAPTSEGGWCRRPASSSVSPILPGLAVLCSPLGTQSCLSGTKANFTSFWKMAIKWENLTECVGMGPFVESRQCEETHVCGDLMQEKTRGLWDSLGLCEVRMYSSLMSRGHRNRMWQDEHLANDLEFSPSRDGNSGGQVGFLKGLSSDGSQHKIWKERRWNYNFHQELLKEEIRVVHTSDNFGKIAFFVMVQTAVWQKSAPPAKNCDTRLLKLTSSPLSQFTSSQFRIKRESEEILWGLGAKLCSSLF